MKFILNNSITFTILASIAICCNVLPFLHGVGAAQQQTRYLRVRRKEGNNKNIEQSGTSNIIAGHILSTTESQKIKNTNPRKNQGYKLEGAYVLRKTVEEAWNANSHQEVSSGGIDAVPPSPLAADDYAQSMPSDHFSHTSEINMPDPLSRRIESETIKLAFGVMKNATVYHMTDGTDLYKVS